MKNSTVKSPTGLTTPSGSSTGMRSPTGSTGSTMRLFSPDANEKEAYKAIYIVCADAFERIDRLGQDIPMMKHSGKPGPEPSQDEFTGSPPSLKAVTFTRNGQWAQWFIAMYAPAGARLFGKKKTIPLKDIENIALLEGSIRIYVPSKVIQLSPNYSAEITAAAWFEAIAASLKLRNLQVAEMNAGRELYQHRINGKPLTRSMSNSRIMTKMKSSLSLASSPSRTPRDLQTEDMVKEVYRIASFSTASPSQNAGKSTPSTSLNKSESLDGFISAVGGSQSSPRAVAAARSELEKLSASTKTPSPRALSPSPVLGRDPSAVSPRSPGSPGSPRSPRSPSKEVSRGKPMSLPSLKLLTQQSSPYSSPRSPTRRGSPKKAQEKDDSYFTTPRSPESPASAFRIASDMSKKYLKERPESPRAFEEETKVGDEKQFKVLATAKATTPNSPRSRLFVKSPRSGRASPTRVEVEPRYRSPPASPSAKQPNAEVVVVQEKAVVEPLNDSIRVKAPQDDKADPVAPSRVTGKTISVTGRTEVKRGSMLPVASNLSNKTHDEDQHNEAIEDLVVHVHGFDNDEPSVETDAFNAGRYEEDSVEKVSLSRRVSSSFSRSAGAEAQVGTSPQSEAGPRRESQSEAGPRRKSQSEAGYRREPQSEAGYRRESQSEAGYRRESAADLYVETSFESGVMQQDSSNMVGSEASAPARVVSPTIATSLPSHFNESSSLKRLKSPTSIVVVDHSLFAMHFTTAMQMNIHKMRDTWWLCLTTMGLEEKPVCLHFTVDDVIAADIDSNSGRSGLFRLLLRYPSRLTNSCLMSPSETQDTHHYTVKARDGQRTSIKLYPESPSDIFMLNPQAHVCGWLFCKAVDPNDPMLFLESLHERCTM